MFSIHKIRFPKKEPETKDSEKTEDEEAIWMKAVRFKGLKSSSSSERRPVLAERGEEEEDDWEGRIHICAHEHGPHYGYGHHP